MATSTSAGDKPATQNKRKRVLQPVLPALPQLPLPRNKTTPNIQPLEQPTNGIGESTLDQTGRQTASQTHDGLANGSHDRNEQKDVGKDVPAEMSASSLDGTTTSQLDSIPSLLESTNTQELPSATYLPLFSLPPEDSLPPVESQLEPLPISNQNDTPGNLSFPPSLTEVRSARPRDRQITFLGPTDSPSPSRTTLRSTSGLPESSAPSNTPEDQLGWTNADGDALGLDNISSSSLQGTHIEKTDIAELPERSDSLSPDAGYLRQSISEVEPGVGPAVSDPAQSFDGMNNAREDDVPSDPAQRETEPILPIQNGDFDLSSKEESSAQQQLASVNGESRVPADGYERVELNSDSSHPRNDQGPYPASAEHSLPAISQHLSTLFLTKEWADWSIEVTAPVSIFTSVAYIAHGVVMARSPTLCQKMRQGLVEHHVPHVIRLSPDRYIQPPALEAALQYLYTERLLAVPDLPKIFSTESTKKKLAREHLFDCILSYWMAGSILGLQVVTERAYTLLAEILSWDILEVALQEALALGERGTHVVPELSNGIPSTQESSEAESANATSPWRAAVSPSPDQHPSTRSASLSPPYHYPAINAAISRSLKQAVFEFICSHLDLPVLDIESPSATILTSYLPNTYEYSNSSRHVSNPALATIRFGNMPLADEGDIQEATESLAPRVPNQIVSAIILNLTFTDLSNFCSVLKDSQISLGTADGQARKWMEQIVAEREDRRRRVLSSKTVSNQERQSKEYAWRVVGWEEHVDATDDDGGWELRRTWQGFTIPTR